MAKSKNEPNNTPSTSNSNPLYPSTSEPSKGANYPASCDNTGVVVNPVVDKSDSSSSQNISISSINENDNDSSAFESSDSECDDEQIKKAIERIPNSLQPGGQLVQNGMLTVKNDNGSPSTNRGPNIGSIAVQNSSDITFGNKTYIKGQVVIKNIYHDRQDGVVNQGYQRDGEAEGEPEITKQNTSDPLSPKEPATWRSSLKAIIRDKPLLCAGILIAMMLVITFIIIAAYVASTAGKPIIKPHYGDGDDDRAYVPPDTGIDEDFFPDPKPLRIVTRNEWLAQPPKEDLELLKLPVHKVIIAHTATEGCSTQTACTYRMRFIQNIHNEMDFGDIGYNFLIGGDGNVYEGRGWLKKGAFLVGQNSKSEGIAFIGDYQRKQPTADQMGLLDSLLANGTRSGFLVDDFKLYGARQWQATISPGDMLYEQLKKHPRWSDDLVD
ncbi:peptidoglycan-recognition protein LC-like isoform X3 [Sabethes cyaneus]|uniref:peptidoglycan-recognition protein LC-like isoform X3 n=1 Tax=Sabethes cyaneus TaxID=53552 RepID=UPI00237DB090|nr:peptidoglycan-recognition protein LC-like isoform X3 [Sabethes cyaneus]